LFVALLPAQEESEAGRKPVVIPDAEKTKLAALLPDMAGFGGKAAEPAHFYLSDLYEYIDGGAEVFHNYGMRAMIHQEYRAGKTDLTVDIYNMGDPLNAFGMYSAERSPDYHFIRIGAEGYVNDFILNFLQGSYYVKLSAFSEGDKPESMLNAVAVSISGKIGSGRSVPRAFAFPAQGLVERSEKYVVRAPLGHEFLAPAATAVYRFQGKDTTVIVSLASSTAGAAERAARLKDRFAQTGKVSPLAGLGATAFRGSNSAEGEMLFFARGSNLVIVASPPAQSDNFLEELFSSIKD
jgi:hypothetical protein